MLDNKDILDLWKLFIDGDDDAYAQIYSSLSEYMFQYGSYFSNSKEQIEDAIHDVFVHIYGNRQKLANVNNVKLYLLISLKNVLISSNSSKLHSKLTYIEASYSTDQNIENEIIALEHMSAQKKLLTNIFQRLSSRQKEAVYYRFIENMSYKEIALKMDINAQSAKNIIQSTIKKIKANFSKLSN